MSRIGLALLCAALTLSSLAQTVPSGRLSETPDLSQVLNFEAEPSGSMPAGWNGGPAGTISIDDKIVHAGKRSVRIERKPDSPSTFSVLTKVLPLDFSGATIELRGFLRTEEVSGFAGLWMREDQDGAVVAFDNMQSRQLKGTTGWTEYSITLPVHPGAQQLLIGVLITGTGKAWADDLQLLVDGKPIAQVPKLARESTVLDRDRQFDGGSGIVLDTLTATQIENLVTLGKVWGFLKYYHPQVTSGKRHWDYELFRILPSILTASDRASANTILVRWIDGLGKLDSCVHCGALAEDDLELRPDLGWISNEALLGKDLSKTLVSIQRNREPGKQFYVSLFQVVKNPSFDHELGYEKVKLPDAGFQILGLYRFWNIIEYWSPYRDIVGANWDDVLRQFLPQIALARNSEDYQRELMQLIGKAHDTHANLWSSLRVRPPVGDCRLPINVRFVEEHPLVVSFASADAAARAVELKVGDVITDLGGIPVDKLIASWSPYYADSNEAARMRDIAKSMTNGPCGPVTVAVRRGTHVLSITTNRLPVSGMASISSTHDLPGDTFRLLSDQVAYLKLSSIKVTDVDHYLEEAAKTKGLIIDIRNYPSEFSVFALGSHLIDKPTTFAQFTNGDLSNPGAFHWTPPVSLSPLAPRYKGKIVILVDEISQSQAEYTAMAFRSAPGAIVIGSATAGADGNVSSFALPGGLRTMISGIGVFYPDKRPTQRIGIVPDIVVSPTMRGLQAGRDEVLESAVRKIMGPDTPAATGQNMTRTPVRASTP
jgi:C-terminal processing protease CtpA/Prc